mmetsp:Transcript_7118/g.20821  ORF Transcript_7118/g.20821 Transcript_7118/m.20821 type:complete len:200 (+) Transcript_7118:1391-1990(+)
MLTPRFRKGNAVARMAPMLVDPRARRTPLQPNRGAGRYCRALTATTMAAATALHLRRALDSTQCPGSRHEASRLAECVSCARVRHRLRIRLSLGLRPRLGPRPRLGLTALLAGDAGSAITAALRPRISGRAALRGLGLGLTSSGRLEVWLRLRLGLGSAGRPGPSPSDELMRRCPGQSRRGGSPGTAPSAPSVAPGSAE